MSALVSPRTDRARFRAVTLIAVAAIAMTSIAAMWPTGRVAADTRRLELQSASVVGPFSGAALAPAERLDPPGAVVDASVVQAPAAVPVVTGPVASAPVNRSSCRANLSGAVMTITIPDISYSCPVYAGGQKMLNSGAVTQITDEAIRRVLADHPGGPGVLWIAGHRTSHGGAFADVPDLADGAIITLADGTYAASYRVVGRIYVGIRNDRVIDAAGNATGAATLDSIIRPDHGGHGAARLLLQTCDGDNNRWMIYADLVTG